MTSRITVFDVADYILTKSDEPLLSSKLQRLCYYSQAWHLAWEGVPLFEEDFDAWMFGPMCPELYAWHKGELKVSKCVEGNYGKLTRNQMDSIDSVMEFYGSRDSYYLTQLSIAESPWRDARVNIRPGQKEGPTIPKESLTTYYASL